MVPNFKNKKQPKSLRFSQSPIQPKGYPRKSKKPRKNQPKRYPKIPTNPKKKISKKKIKKLRGFCKVKIFMR